MPTPSTHKGHEDKWEKLETEGMKEVIGWYGKTWHFWEVDKGHELSLGHPKLMGSLTGLSRTNIDEVLKDKNRQGDVDRKDKAKKRRLRHPAYTRMLIVGGRRRTPESSPIDLIKTQGVCEIQSRRDGGGTKPMKNFHISGPTFIMNIGFTGQ